MAMCTLSAVALLLLVQLTAGADKQPPVRITELTDENFDELTASGTWFVDIFAPWCSHCRQLEPIWIALAEDLNNEKSDVRLAKVDGTKQRTLLQRFRVNAFPSLYFLKDGRTYVYQGSRNLQAFKEFVTSGYQQAEMLPMYQSPNSLVGRLLGKMHGLPQRAKQVYRHLHHDRGYSDVVLVIGFLTIPVALGAAIICCLDAAYVRRARYDNDEHEHRE